MRRTHARNLWKRNIEQLRIAIKVLHEEDYMHGDVRGPNIFTTTYSLKLIDFNWCGKAGEARYPVDIILTSDTQWHEDVCRGGLTTKDHVERMFKDLARAAYMVYD